jgi:hypothetical protein
MNQRKVYQKPQQTAQERVRKEWVTLDGGDVCVWGLTAGELMHLTEKSARPAVDPRGGADPRMASAWLIALATHYGDDPDSPRIWDDLTYEEIFDLTSQEFTALTEAIGRVMGTALPETEALRAFTPAAEAPNSSDLPSSALNNSTGFPLRLTPLTTS